MRIPRVEVYYSPLLFFSSQFSVLTCRASRASRACFVSKYFSLRLIRYPRKNSELQSLLLCALLSFKS